MEFDQRFVLTGKLFIEDKKEGKSRLVDKLR